MVEDLKIGPYIFKVVPLYDGPLLEVKGEAEALAQLVNNAVASPELADAIRGAREGVNPVVTVIPPADDEEDRALRTAWAARTGERPEPGEVANVIPLWQAESVPISWEALQKSLEALEELRANWRPEPGPRFFVRTAREPLYLTPQDFEVVKALDKEAQAIDELDAQSEVGREPSSLIARRREFLTACRDAGVFSSDHSKAREQWLHNWSAEHLLALRRAAVQLSAWNLLKGDEQPPDGSACLDYVRLQLWPPGEDGEAWAGEVLRLLPHASVDEQGAVIEKVGSSRVRVFWRRDGERPALLAVARG